MSGGLSTGEFRFQRAQRKVMEKGGLRKGGEDRGDMKKSGNQKWEKEWQPETDLGHRLKMAWMGAQ